MPCFPKDFLWGAATSSYQVEGDNQNADWWPWELKAGKEPSGQACRHYQLYDQDFELAKSLGHNAHRFSVEWSRIEPREGCFEDAELDHYMAVLSALRSRGIEPVVTLHHFTNPIWLSALGGWHNPKSVDYFSRFCQRVVERLATHVRYWITINEPTVYAAQGYIFGHWPPQEKLSYSNARAVLRHFTDAHIKVYSLIQAVYQRQTLARPLIGIAHHMQPYVACTRRWRDLLAVYLRNRVGNYALLDEMSAHNSLDFIGLNYYSRQRVELQGFSLGRLITDVCVHDHDPVKKNSLGWDIYPRGLLQILTSLKKYRLPVLITENGICTEDDQLRWEFIALHLEQLYQAIEQGIPVIGYLHWSLLDNFEWDKGFGPRFGLVGVNYTTFERTVKESARKFAAVCRSGQIP